MSFLRASTLLLAVALPLVVTAKARPAAPPVRPPAYETRTVHDPDGIGKFYMGREIAQVMGHEGAGWLERPTRLAEERTDKLLKALNLKPGLMVADIGAGSGFFTFPIAKKVGPKGKVYAVDIQKEMLTIIRKRMAKGKVANVVPVLGTETDPKLAANTFDLIFMVDVYHGSHPFEMTQAMVKALKPGGQLVFVEYRLEDPEVYIKLVHKMTVRQVIREMRPHPLRHSRTSDILPQQHIIVFEKLAPP